jgi:hypothetical protein
MPKAGCSKAVQAGVVALLLAGCAAAPTPYQQQNQEGQGYREQRIEANRFRVSFSGNTFTSRETVENYLIYRAAELTIANGYDWFVLAGKETEAHTRYDQMVTNMGFGPYFAWDYWPRNSVAVSTAIPVTDYQAYGYVTMFKGTKPATDPTAFDARAVEQSLAPTVQRTPPPH